MNPKELAANFVKARKVISDLFDVAWLESGTENELQKLWNRTDWIDSKADWIACTELLIFGNCLEKCKQINEDRTKYFVEKIKRSKNHNERKGAIYEIIVAGAYYNEGHSVVEFPTNPNNSSYDLKLMQDEFNIYISIKNYGLFGRVEGFVEKSKVIKELIKQNLQKGCNTVFIINDKSFPSLLDWRSLQENLPKLLNSDSKKTVDGDWSIPLEDGWSISVKYATGNEPDSMRNIALPGPICSDKESYILFLFTKLHQNDLTNLFEKIFDEACENFENHGKDDPKSINIVFLRVPREIDLGSCKKASIDYYKRNGNSKVSGIFLYQPEFAGSRKDEFSGESLAHCYEFIINPHMGEILNSRRIKLIPKFIVGIWNKGSTPIMFVTGKNNIISGDTEYYKYQSGHIYYQPTKDKHNQKMVNGILMGPCGSLTEIDKQRRMLLPESNDLLLL
ncbi:MAG: hypothetical protein ACYDHX_07600 [Methanothrix sp.]